ncbi:MAG TPA: hypothetical protein VIT65_17380 [Microlunatus sp.]
MSAPTAQQPSRGVAVPAAVGVVIAAVVAVLVVVSVVVSLTEDRLPTGPALPPPAAMAPTVSFDAPTRIVRYAEVTTRMPGTPYTCPETPGSTPPLLSSGILCSAPVHPDYEGTSDWTATAGFGSVADGITRPTAEATARAFFATFRSVAFDNRTTTLAKLATDQADLDGHQVALVSGNVGYTVPGVPSSFDRVLVVVLPVDDGDYAVYFSSRPDDTPKATLDVLNASIDGLSYD